MKLGFVSAILPELSLEDVLAFAATEGFAVVELMCWPVGRADRRFAGVTHVDVAALTPASAEALRRQSHDRGVGISGLGYYPNMLDPDPDVADVAVAQFRRVIDAAALLGIGTVNTFVGRDWHRTVDDNWPRFLDTWRPLLAHAAQAGVRVALAKL